MAIKVTNESIAAKTAAYLLEVEAVKLRPDDPFTWASGWKSPIYCDNRLTLSFPEVRSYITKALVEVIKAEYPDVEAIAGVATAGIPQGALVAAELNIPMLYVRSKAKGHGMTNLIEGKILANREGYGFLATDKSKHPSTEDIYLNNREMRKAFDGDVALRGLSPPGLLAGRG